MDHSATQRESEENAENGTFALEFSHYALHTVKSRMNRRVANTSLTHASYYTALFSSDSERRDKKHV